MRKKRDREEKGGGVTSAWYTWIRRIGQHLPMRSLTSRQLRYIKAKFKGATKKQAALEAGYSLSTALHGCIETPRVLEATRKMAEGEGLSLDKVAQELALGLKKAWATDNLRMHLRYLKIILSTYGL